MLYNKYNDNNQYAIKIMSIAIVFLEIFTFLPINGTYFQKRGLNYPNGGSENNNINNNKK